MISIFSNRPRILFLLFFLCASLFGQVKLPKIISDGMVLQRDAEVKVWGWAANNEEVSVLFIDSTVHYESE